MWLQMSRVRAPSLTPFFLDFNAPVAQLDRVPDFESVGRRFESCRAHHSSAEGEIAHDTQNFMVLGHTFSIESEGQLAGGSCYNKITEDKERDRLSIYYFLGY
jgi:hypothetical protein